MLTPAELEHAQWHAAKPVGMALHFGCAVCSDGTVVQWGTVGAGSHAQPPACVRGGWRVRSVAVGYQHAVAVLEGGAVVGWGAGVRQGRQAPAPAVPAYIRGQGVVCAAAGCGWTVYVLADGSLATQGERALDAPVLDVAHPGNRAVAVAAGFGHGLAVLKSGAVVGWGLQSDGFGKQGFAQAVPPPPPAEGLRAVAVAAGGFHSIVLWHTGALSFSGCNTDGQCVPGARLEGRRVVAVAAGLVTSFAVDADGYLVAWGKGSPVPSISTHDPVFPGWWALVPPLGLTGPRGRRRMVCVAAGNLAAAGVLADGVLVGWGDDLDGRACPPGTFPQSLRVAAAPPPPLFAGEGVA